jgi:hypothetical protein
LSRALYLSSQAELDDAPVAADQAAAADFDVGELEGFYASCDNRETYTLALAFLKKFAVGPSLLRCDAKLLYAGGTRANTWRLVRPKSFSLGKNGLSLLCEEGAEIRIYLTNKILEIKLAPHPSNNGDKDEDKDEDEDEDKPEPKPAAAGASSVDADVEKVHVFGFNLVVNPW